MAAEELRCRDGGGAGCAHEAEILRQAETRRDNRLLALPNPPCVSKRLHIGVVADAIRDGGRSREMRQVIERYVCDICGRSIQKNQFDCLEGKSVKIRDGIIARPVEMYL